VNLGYQTSEEAIKVAEECADIFSRAGAYASHGIGSFAKGVLPEAEKSLLKGINFCEKIDFPVWETMAYQFLGRFHFENKDFGKSEQSHTQAIRICMDNRLFPSLMKLNSIDKAKAQILEDENNIDLRLLYRHEKENKLKLIEGWMAGDIGEILMNISSEHLSEAEHWIQKALDADVRNGTRLPLGLHYALYAELLKKKGNRDEAKKNYGKAIETLKDCGADGWAEKFEKELGVLS
jgi:tetratricopeptide (TPR) repeat protein